MNSPPTHTRTGSIGYGKGEQVEQEEISDLEEAPMSYEENEDATAGKEARRNHAACMAVPADQDEESSRDPPQDAADASSTNEAQKYFKDVEETGRWGDISKREILVAVGIMILIVATVIGVTVYFVTKDDDSPATMPTSPVSPPTPSPTQAPTVSPELQLDAIRSAVVANIHTQATSVFLPEDINFYEDKYRDPAAVPAVRAASWVVFEDPVDAGTTVVERYALAVVYFSTQGDLWFNNDGWLTGTSYCDWYGLICDGQQRLQAIDLSSNNLKGPIPAEVNFLESLVEITLTKNSLIGNLPALALGNLPSLGLLYVDDNQLTGEVSFDLRANGVLNTLFIQLNNFTGLFPLAFCPRRVGDPDILREFGLDCSELSCFCCDIDNCF